MRVWVFGDVLNNKIKAHYGEVNDLAGLFENRFGFWVTDIKFFNRHPSIGKAYFFCKVDCFSFREYVGDRVAEAFKKWLGEG